MWKTANKQQLNGVKEVWAEFIAEDVCKAGNDSTKMCLHVS